MSSSRTAVPAIALLALAALAACDAGMPSEPELAAAASSAAAKRAVAPVCHFDSETSAYVRLELVAPAVAAHRGHGDLAPGEPVPGQLHYILDFGCAPAFVAYAEVEQLTQVAAVYEAGLFHGSAGGEVTGNVTAVDINLIGNRLNTSGCEAADFAGIDFSGPNDIALFQRGGCNFADKALNATMAGAEAVLIFNQGDAPDRLGPITSASVELLTDGTRVVPTVPVAGVSFAAGETLAQPGSTARVAAILTD